MAGFGAALFPVCTVTIEAGVADRVLSFRTPVPCQVIEMHSAGDAVDSTDKFAAILKQGATTLLTGTTIVTPDVTVVDTADQVFLGKDIDYSLTIDFSGTAANVKGVLVTVWAQVHR